MSDRPKVYNLVQQTRECVSLHLTQRVCAPSVALLKVPGGTLGLSSFRNGHPKKQRQERHNDPDDSCNTASSCGNTLPESPLPDA